MRPLFTNLAVGRLAAPITSTATSFTLQPGQGAAFPSPGTGQVAILTLQSGAAYEIVHCTSRADDVFNVIRAREGTAAQAWPSGTTVELRVTAGGLNAVVDMADDAVATANAASATANTALTTANTANTTANTALTTANNALTAAGNAQTTADNALNVANAALPRSGAQPMLGRLDLAAGTNGGLAFVGDTDTGLVQSDADTLQLRTGGDVRLTIANAGIQVHAPITVPAATAAGHAVRLDQLPKVLELVQETILSSTVSFVSFTLPDEDYIYTLLGENVSLSVTPSDVNVWIFLEVAFDTVPTWQTTGYGVDTRIALAARLSDQSWSALRFYFVVDFHTIAMANARKLICSNGVSSYTLNSSLTAYPHHNRFLTPSNSSRIRAIRFRSIGDLSVSYSLSSGVFRLYRLKA